MKKIVMAATAILVLASAAAAGLIPIGPADYAKRRAAIYAKMPPGSALLILGGDTIKDEELFYFTGVSVKGTMFFGLKDGPQEVLFLPPASPGYGVVEDVKLSPGKAAEAATGIGRTAVNTDFEKTVAPLLKGVSKIYVDKLMDRPDPLGISATPQAALLAKLTAAKPGLAVEDAFFPMAEIRGVKSPAEIERMRRAVEICGLGVVEAMKYAAPGLFEYHLEAAVNFVYRAAGARTIFNIIGAGPNSVILHHRLNDRRLDAGDLVLVDVGAEFDHYGSDITRTFPVSGTFTPEQRKIYDIVLDANKKTIAKAGPGVTAEDLEKFAHKIIEDAGYGKFFNHGVSHPINMGPMGELKPGTIITVEPGIYLPEKGFGIRIEDDVLITETGREVLSAAVPKEAADIEKLMKQASVLERLAPVK